MISSTFCQENGPRKSQIRLSSNHDHSSVNFLLGGVSGPRPRPGCGMEPPSKRFKPNTNGTRTRISFDGAEEAFRSEPPKSTFAPFVKTNFSPQSNGSCECSNTSQAGTYGTTEEEDSDEDGSKPLRGSKHRILKNNPSLYGDRSESVTTASPITSPLTTAMKPCELVRDLSLGRDDSTSTKSEEFDEKAFLEDIKRDVSQKGFTCLSTKCPTVDTCLTFRCPEGHTFVTKEFGLTREITCPKCQKLLEKCVEYAKSHNGCSLTLYQNNRKGIEQKI